MKVPDSKYCMIFIIYISSVFPLSSKVFSQKSDTTGINDDGGKTEKMNHHLAVKLELNNHLEGFAVRSDNNNYDIQPNTSLAFKISVNYRFISMSVKTAPAFLPGNNDDELKGETRAGSYMININFKHFIQHLSYTDLKGFYLHNTSDYVIDWIRNEDGYIQFPELYYQGLHGYTGYKLNPEFSLKALLVQTERQTRNAGSFIPLLLYRYYVVDNKVELTGQNSSQKSNNFELILSPGYYYTFSYKKSYYLSAGIIPGAGFINTRLLTRLPSGDYVNSYHNPIYRLETQLAFGYNSERFFIGSQFAASWAAYDQHKTSTIIVHNRLNYQIFIGYRFQAPNVLKTVADKIER